MTPPAVTGDCISQNTWYFYSTTADQGGVWYFGGGVMSRSPAVQEDRSKPLSGRIKMVDTAQSGTNHCSLRLQTTRRKEISSERKSVWFWETSYLSFVGVMVQDGISFSRCTMTIHFNGHPCCNATLKTTCRFWPRKAEPS